MAALIHNHTTTFANMMVYTHYQLKGRCPLSNIDAKNKKQNFQRQNVLFIFPIMQVQLDDVASIRYDVQINPTVETLLRLHHQNSRCAGDSLVLVMWLLSERHSLINYPMIVDQGTNETKGNLRQHTQPLEVHKSLN